MAVLASATAAIAAIQIAGCDFSGNEQVLEDAKHTTTTAPTTSTVTGAGGGAITGTTRADVLNAVGTCTVAIYRDFANAMSELETASRTSADSPTVESSLAARAAWVKAIGVWQQAEVVRVGIIGPKSQPEGNALRDYVYSWPVVSRCQVEQTLVGKKYEPLSPSGLLNARGLIAAEYLLFYEGTDNGCSATTSINKDGTWAALGADEIAQRKRAFAAALASDVAVRAREIADAWAPNGGAFGARLATPGGNGSPFPTEAAAFNAIIDGMFYLEHQVTDLKIGKPLGIFECDSTACPDAVESQYARISRDHVRNNLLGLRRLFAGCDESGQVGFDDHLVSVGAGQAATRLFASLDAALAAADALSASDFELELAADRGGLENLHTSVKNFATTLRTEFVAVLDHAPPVIVGDPDN